jgi:hypothetical protein
LTAALNAFKIIATFVALILLKFADRVAKVGWSSSRATSMSHE